MTDDLRGCVVVGGYNEGTPFLRIVHPCDAVSMDVKPYDSDRIVMETYCGDKPLIYEIPPHCRRGAARTRRRQTAACRRR